MGLNRINTICISFQGQKMEIIETGFNLSRETFINNEWKDILYFNLPATSNNYIDLFLSPGTYRYKIRSYDDTGYSSWTNPVVATVSVIPENPDSGTGPTSGSGGSTLTIPNPVSSITATVSF